MKKSKREVFDGQVHAVLYKKLISHLNDFFFVSELEKLKSVEDVCGFILEKYTEPSMSPLGVDVLELQFQLEECRKNKKLADNAIASMNITNELIKVFKNKRIGLIGGSPQERLAFKEYVTKKIGKDVVKFKESEPDIVKAHSKFKEKYLEFDAIVLVYGCIGHDLSRHVQKLRDDSAFHGQVLNYECLSGKNVDDAFNSLACTFLKNKNY
ncbi:MAG: hypothetical protein ACRCT7_11130 [Shewanella sp.]